MPRLALPLVALALLLAACATPEETPPPAADAPDIVMATYADTLAMRTFEAMGGPEAWASVPALRFNFGLERDGEHQVARRHAWNRQTGDYRVEWQQGPDSAYVALFDVNDVTDNTPAGQVYLNGEPVAAEANEALLQRAYGGYINDTYWLLMPTKLFDPGVTRTYAADSSDADAEVIHLSFGDVGLTPGDQYWVYADPTTGLVDGWAYRLQSGRESRSMWTGYETYTAPGGEVVVATRKASPDGTFALLTDSVSIEPLPEAMFTDPTPGML